MKKLNVHSLILLFNIAVVCAQVNPDAQNTERQQAIQQIPLNSGWNLVSSFMMADDMVLDSLFKDIEDEIIIVKNIEGQVFFPSIPINLIGDWDISQGYLVKTNSATTLEICCEQVDSATALSLDAGWNIIPFYLVAPLAVDVVFEGIEDEIILVKDGAGSIYTPSLGIDLIGDMRPGRGYYVKLSASATLRFSPNCGDGIQNGNETGVDCGGPDCDNCPNTFYDARDGKTYNTVTINGQEWFSENLCYGAGASYTPHSLYIADFCYVYTYPEAMNSCPEGSHLPSNAEWTALTDFLGGASIAGGKLKVPGETYWANNTGATNEVGFNARGGGYRNGFSGSLGYVRTSGTWWTSTSSSQFAVTSRGMTGLGIAVGTSTNSWPGDGYSVRCIVDE